MSEAGSTAALLGVGKLDAIAAALTAWAEKVEVMRGPAGVSPPDRTEEIKATCAEWIAARSDAARAAIETKLVALVDSLTDKRALEAAEAAAAIAIAPLPDLIAEEVTTQVAAIPRVKGDKGDPGKDAVAKDGKDGKPGLVWRGPWKSGRTYEKGDAFEFEGSSYIVTAATTRERPSESARDMDLLAKAGKDGKPGMIVVGGASTGGNGGVADSVSWDGITGKPGTFPPSDHEHPNYVARLLALETEAGIELQITNVAEDGPVGDAYSFQYTSANGNSPYAWTAEGLPDGWALSTSGELTGPAAEVATIAFTVTVTDAYGRTASLEDSLDITDVPANAITTDDGDPITTDDGDYITTDA